MADGFGYGGFTGSPHPYWLCSPYQYPSPSTPPFIATYPVQSYVQTRVGFDPTIPHGGGSYHRSPSYGDDSFPPTPSSSLYSQSGNHVGHGGEDSCKDKFSSPPMERQREAPYSSATVSSLADMLIRNSKEPFYLPIPPSGVCVTTTNAFDLNRPLPGHDYSGFGTRDESVSAAAVSGPPPVPYLCVPSSFKSEASSDGSQTGIRLGDGRSFGDNDSPDYIQSSLHDGAVLGHGEATRHVKPLSENPTGSRSPRSSHPLQFDAKSSLYQKPTTLVADSGNESSWKNAIGDLNFDERHSSWNQFVVSSEGLSAPSLFSIGSESRGAMIADNRNPARSAVIYETHSQGSEDVQAKTCKLQEQFDKSADGVSAGQSPVCDQGDFASPASSTRVSSVVNALHDLSEVLVYECFSYGSSPKPEQLEKIVENLTKCLKKITGNKTIAGEEASVPTRDLHVSLPNLFDLNEASDVVARDCQGVNVKPHDSFGFKEPVDKDKNEMTQSIKNILASNFPDGEENHPQTLLYKNLWLETEAALCSTTCLTRYHRPKNEIGNLNLQNKEISADASTFVQEPCLNHQKSVSIIDKVEQETAEPLIKHGSSFGNNVVTMSHDGPQSSRFNSAPVDAVLSLMSSSFTGGLEEENHGNFKQESPASTTEENHNDVIDRFQILKHQETMRKLKSQNCSDPDIGVIDRFQILEDQETMRKLKSQDFSETRMDEQKDNPDAPEMATIGRSSHMSDVMGRFQLLKRREAEQVQKSLNSVDFDSDSDSDFESDSDSDQPRNRTQSCDYLWSGSMMTTGGNSQIETCTNTEPSDWELVLEDV